MVATERLERRQIAGDHGVDRGLEDPVHRLIAARHGRFWSAPTKRVRARSRKRR
jgi:hypothetical protein